MSYSVRANSIAGLTQLVPRGKGDGTTRDYSSMDKICGYEPQDGSSILSSPANPLCRKRAKQNQTSCMNGERCSKEIYACRIQEPMTL